MLSPLHGRPDLLAERLLHRFGSIAKISQAPDADLRCAALDGEPWIDAFLMVRRLILDGMREEMIRTPLGASRAALHTYLLATLQELQEERMIAIFADHKGFVLSEEMIAEGSNFEVSVTPRRIFSRAMKLDAGIILLAHNHPSGCAQPSALDIKQTRLLCNHARALGLKIEDHLIVGRREVMSMKDLGLL